MSWESLIADSRRKTSEGEISAALGLARQALEAARSQFGASHIAVAWCQREVGAALVDERASEAEELLRDALAMAEKTWKSDDPRLSDFVHAVGRALHSQGRLRDAEEFYRRALDLRELSYGPDDLGIVPYLRDLARLRADGMGGWAEGEPLVHRAIEILETRVNGSLEPQEEWGAALRDLAATHLALGGILMTAGLAVEAEKSFQKSVEHLEACKVRGIAFRIAMLDDLRKMWFESLQRRGRTTEVVEKRLTALGARSAPASDSKIAEQSFWMDFELAVENLRRDGKDEKAIAGALADVLSGKPLPELLDRDPLRTLSRGLVKRAEMPDVRERVAAALGKAAGGSVKLGEAIREIRAAIK